MGICTFWASGLLFLLHNLGLTVGIYCTVLELKIVIFRMHQRIYTFWGLRMILFRTFGGLRNIMFFFFSHFCGSGIHYLHIVGLKSV